jgi:nicotinate-nucleotide adenylyltransferase
VQNPSPAHHPGTNLERVRIAAPAAPIGVYGGVFDPVHKAHLALARAALDDLHLGQLLWVPAGLPSHRQTPEAAPIHRLAMVKLATRHEPRYAVDAHDVTVGLVSRTVPMLERLRAHWGASTPLVLLLGADAFRALPTWYRWHDLFDLAHLAVAARPGAPLDHSTFPPELARQWTLRYRKAWAHERHRPSGCIIDFAIKPVQPADLSATLLRARLHSAPLDAAALTLPAVWDYIVAHGLYGTTCR